jgi:hypothetical protein
LCLGKVWPEIIVKIMIALQKGISDQNVGENSLFAILFIDAIPKILLFSSINLGRIPIA